MKLTITCQESYSRGELLLRSIFGMIYIAVPHIFVMVFVSIWANIVNFIAWWAILFTAKYPKGFFEFMAKFYNWNVRLNASLMNLTDGYPAIGVGGTSDKANLTIAYPERLSRGTLLLKTIFGAIYVVIPHQFCLIFREIASNFLSFIAWWVVLFTGKYPADWHAFNVGTLRWYMRVNLYLRLMTDDYPPFSGKE